MGKSLKKRICIYVVYDSENIVDDYVGYMLKEMKKVCSFLVVVCNFEYIQKGSDNIKPYADKVFFRKNIGFDAGAYKDALCEYLDWDEIQKYDELVLANDSFYGPFYPMEQVFLEMERGGADYWGMTRSLAGTYVDGDSFSAHIQSYFLCFKKTVIQNLAFQKFWEKISYPKTLSLAVRYFELDLNQELILWGFCGVALTDFSPSAFLKENENPYLLYSLELIRDSRIPFLKRKSLDLGNKGFSNALKALEYIEEKTDYDTGLIKEHLLRLSRCVMNQGMLSFSALEEFYQSRSKIYFYGAGTYGKNLAILFERLGWSFEGFLITDAKETPPRHTKFEDAAIEPEDGVIITVGNKETFLEILENIGNRCKREQLLFPNYMIQGS